MSEAKIAQRPCQLRNPSERMYWEERSLKSVRKRTVPCSLMNRKYIIKTHFYQEQTIMPAHTTLFEVYVSSS